MARCRHFLPTGQEEGNAKTAFIQANYQINFNWLTNFPSDLVNSLDLAKKASKNLESTSSLLVAKQVIAGGADAADAMLRRC